MESKDIFDRVVLLCRYYGISQKQLETDLRLSKGRISKWRHTPPNFNEIVALSLYFDISIHYLITGEHIVDKMKARFERR